MLINNPILSDSLIQGLLALVLTIGVIACYLLTRTIPDILSYSLTTVIAFYFGSRVGEAKSRNMRSTGSVPKVA